MWNCWWAALSSKWTFRELWVPSSLLSVEPLCLENRQVITADTRPLSMMKPRGLNQSPSPLYVCQVANVVAVECSFQAKGAIHPFRRLHSRESQGLLSVWDLRTPQQRGFKGPQGLQSVYR